MKDENLKRLGFDNWFSERTDTQSFSGLLPARVISVNKNSFIVANGSKEIFAEMTGKFSFASESSLDLPAVGDWVYAQFFDDDTFAVIHGIFPRKSLLKRKTAGKKIEFQLIAANIDTAIIMQSLDNNYNPRRLERYLVIVNENGITPVVFLSKSDLISPEEIEKKKEEIHSIIPGIQIEAFSNFNDTETEDIKSFFEPGKTYCLLGSSGVGKTTLLNNLLHENVFKTQPVREKDDRGKHTTTRRELIILDNGAMIVDNPGMRELGVMSVESAIDDTFAEISHLAEECRYKDCTHTIEKGCAILKALDEGTISKERYSNYLKLYKESLYNEMSYLEKRQKDKAFGKFMHSYFKNYKKGGPSE